MVNLSGQVIKRKPEHKPEKPLRNNSETKIQTRQSKQRIALDILESIDDYIRALDRDWNFIYLNKNTATSLGFKPQALIGKNFWKTFPKFVGTLLEKNYRETMVKREVRRFEWETIYAKTGFREFTVFPSADGITVNGVDITERKRLQRKLEEYTKNLEKLVDERTKELKDKERLATIGQTAGMVGHDIRNPLQSITASMYLIKEDLDNLPESREKNDTLAELDSIDEQITYVDKIVSDLQNFAKPLKPDRVIVDLKMIVESALSTINVPENVQTMVYFDENFPKIKADPLLLRRVLVNLTTNAIQAMPEGGELTIQGSHNTNTNQVIITVKDTGVGVPKEIQPMLFKPLFTTKAKGQGFGLAVVKRLVEAQDGKITFESQKGNGTKFTIKLPHKAD
jgi:PAS domain S-box-containing protein